MRSTVSSIRSSENSFIVLTDGATFTVMEYLNGTDGYEYGDVFRTAEEAEEFARKILLQRIANRDYRDDS